MLLRSIAHYISAVSIFVFSAHLAATQITIVDTHGQPVSGAVIGLGSTVTKGTNNKTEKPAIMDQINYRFVPNTLLIKKEDWVDFPNSDNVRHHIYSFSAPNPFEIKMFLGSEAPPVQFNKPGIIVLGCNMHDSMVGYIYVADTQFAAISDKAGIINVAASSPAFKNSKKSAQGLTSATLWHPLLSSSRTKRVDIEIDGSLAQQTIQLEISLQTTLDKKKSNGFSSKFRSGT